MAAGVIAALLVFVIIVAGEGSTLDRNTLEFAGGLPDWLLWLGQLVYVVGVLYGLCLLIGVGLFARDRVDVLRDMLLAVVLAAVVEPVAAGMTEFDDAILVVEAYDTTLADLAIDQVDDDLLDATWGALWALRNAGLANGRLDQTDIWIDSAGAPAISGFSQSTIQSTDLQMNEDVASLLVGTALIVGSQRAIAAARRTLDDERSTAALPVLQTASLSPMLRHQVLPPADLGLDQSAPAAEPRLPVTTP